MEKVKRKKRKEERKGERRVERTGSKDLLQIEGYRYN